LTSGVSLLPLLRDLACVRENLATSMDEFIRLPQETREKLIATLEATEPATLSKEERGLLFQKIREALHWINSYGEEDQRVHAPGLNKMLEKFAPTDVIERVGWLLANPWPKLPEGELREHEANDTRVKTAQTEAAREVLDKAPIDKILEFASTIPYQWVFGHSLAIAVKDENEGNTILDGILAHIADIPILVMGFASGRVEIVGSAWVDEQIRRLKEQGNYSVEGCAVLYFGLPEGSETWSAVGAHGKDVETAYWKQASGHSRTGKKDDAPIAVEKLLDVKRPEVALTIAGSPQADIPSTLLQRLLQEILNMDEKKIRAGVMEEYYLGHVFNQLYQKNDLPLEEIARLEWPFAALFKDFKRYASSPMALHRALQKDPQFFSLLVGFIYKRDDHAPDPTRGRITQEMAENRARIAYKVFDSWDLIPGLKDDGTLDEKELTDWIEAARKQCAETKHVTGCDIQIGFMLAHAPTDSDGTWPHIAVRNVIERLNNETIDRHIQNEIYNSRGVTSRGLNDGGKQERELAERYKKMSDALKVKWPRTSAMLRGIAKSYEDQAKYEDVDSDLHDLRWD